MAWPDFMGALEPEASESTVAAAAPGDVVMVTPSNDLPDAVSAWAGEWVGWAGQARRYDLRLIVESLSPDEARIVCVRASTAQGVSVERASARIQANELRCQLANGASIQFRMRNSDVVEHLWREPDGHWSAGVLARPATGGQALSERVPTAMVELGEQVSLEMVTFKPAGPGPFATLVFNHGSTGIGNDPSLFTATVTSPALAKYFNDRGWMVVFPQRRGRGKSGGRYDEGFEPDRSRYSDLAEHALPGVDRALEDVACVVAHLLARADVDRERLWIGGHSRGGFVALALAGAQPQRFRGAINFAGGWVDEDGAASRTINSAIATRGAAFSGPTLWMYAHHDPFYGIAHSHGNFRAFEAAGGRGQFHVLDVLPGQDGHHIVSRVGLWGPIMDNFLARAEPCAAPDAPN
ncbi:alpha/beta hydrolase family protein [Pseudorhodoferax sp.]|uniref:alpha/beta hydrolase family protein n=1 Tax=Pseudorhodoferax sp. TaxID=1993553 RepID=UPI002DD635E4|nr:alpha/beta fold hydrolase [Pseudorhodoferax sp.]